MTGSAMQRTPNRGEKKMGAKQKLNSSNFVSAIVIAAVVGGMFGSWAVFFISAAVLIAAACHSGDIRQ
jgi:hypothetical protein